MTNEKLARLNAENAFILNTFSKVLTSKKLDKSEANFILSLLNEKLKAVEEEIKNANDEQESDERKKYTLVTSGEIWESNNKTELISKARKLSNPASVIDERIGGIIFENKAQKEINNRI